MLMIYLPDVVDKAAIAAAHVLHEDHHLINYLLTHLFRLLKIEAKRFWQFEFI